MRSENLRVRRAAAPDIEKCDLSACRPTHQLSTIQNIPIYGKLLVRAFVGENRGLGDNGCGAVMARVLFWHSGLAKVPYFLGLIFRNRCDHIIVVWVEGNALYAFFRRLDKIPRAQPGRI